MFRTTMKMNKAASLGAALRRPSMIPKSAGIARAFSTSPLAMSTGKVLMVLYEGGKHAKEQKNCWAV